MTPRQRRSVEAIFQQHGRALPLICDDDVPSFELAGEYGEAPVLRCSPDYLARIYDIRENTLVPELYSDEASTWA